MIIYVGPEPKTLEELAQAVVEAAPVEDLVKEAYGPSYAYIPQNESINESMAELLAWRITRRGRITPMSTLLSVLAENLDDAGILTTTEVVDNLPEGLEKLERAIHERLARHCLQSYVL